MADSNINMKFTANTADAQKNIKDLQGTLEGTSKNLKDTQTESTKATSAVGSFASNAVKSAVSVAALTTAVVALSKGAAQCVQEFSKVERLNDRLVATWNNVGEATGFSAEQLLAYADAVEKSTYFEAESVQSAAQLLAATEKLSEEGFKRALDISVDLAEAMGSDVPNAAQTLATALQNPETGLRALRSIGVTFTEAEKEMITQLNAAGKEFEAQDIILSKVESKYQGIAKAVANTPTNTLTQIGNTLGTIKEDLGEGILNAVAPAMETIYGWLLKIEGWASKWTSKQKTDASNKNVFDKLKSNASLSGFSDKELNDFYAEITTSASFYGTIQERLDMIAKLNSEITARGTQKSGSRNAVFEFEEDITNTDSLLASANGLDSEKDKIDEVTEALENEADALEHVGEAQEKATMSATDMVKSMQGYASSFMTSLSDAWSSQADQMEEALERERKAGTLTEEEEAKRLKEIDALRRKSFEAEKTNNVANALINGALAVTKCLADLGPIAGPIAATLVGATTAIQVGTILGQQYTPMAKGGIVTEATPILAGEAGPEAIIPLSQGRAEKYLGGTGLTLNITIQGNANVDDVYYAIERAQRTGYLPRWSYA